MQILEQDMVYFINNQEISLEEGMKYANNPKYIRENAHR